MCTAGVRAFKSTVAATTSLFLSEGGEVATARGAQAVGGAYLLCRDSFMDQRAWTVLGTSNKARQAARLKGKNCSYHLLLPLS